MVFPKTAYSTLKKLNFESLDSVPVTIYLIKSLSKYLSFPLKKLFNAGLLIGLSSFMTKVPII